MENVRSTVPVEEHPPSKSKVLANSPRLKVRLRHLLDRLLRNASIVSMVLYLAGSLGGLLALSCAGRSGTVDEKAFQLGVAVPRLGASKAADVMRIYRSRRDESTGSLLRDARAMWDYCETHWHHKAGRRHGLVWYEVGDHVVYDVVEATRSDGTESVLIVIPDSVRSMGMAVGHGLGWYLQEQEWLAKNVAIAYVGVSKSGLGEVLEDFLSQVVDRRIGQIGQAVVLDLQAEGGTTAAAVDEMRVSASPTATIPRASIKVHGWNGQLPNLDLFVAVRKLVETHVASQSEVTVHGASTGSDSTWNKAKALIRFLFHHGLGVSDGGHGALLDRGIDALTIRLSLENTNVNLKGTLQMVEALVRCLNNLHERLHHATGLYALAGANVVIDIAMYTVCPVMLAIASALKAYQLTVSKSRVGKSYVTWNQALRRTVRIMCGGAVLYAIWHTLDRHQMDVLVSLGMVFGRIFIFGLLSSAFFGMDGLGQHAGPVRWEAAMAWTLSGASVVLILYRWSLAWIVLIVFLPLIFTK